MARTIAVGILLAALGVLAAGCGSSSTPPASAAASTASFQQFQTCLKQHGVAVPQFNRRPPTGTAPTTTTQHRFGFQRNQTPAQRKAFQACQSKLPQGGLRFRGGRGPGGAPGPHANSPAFAKYTQCLAKHGVKFGKSSSRSAFAKAQAACRSLLPSGA